MHWWENSTRLQEAVRAMSDVPISVLFGRLKVPCNQTNFSSLQILDISND